MSKKPTAPDTKKGEDFLVRNLLSEVLRGCAAGKGATRKTREQVARELGISEALLNAYCAPSLQKDETTGAFRLRAKFPAALTRLFCEATGDDELKLFFLSDHQKHLLKLGEQAEQLVSAASRKRKTE